MIMTGTYRVPEVSGGCLDTREDAAPGGPGIPCGPLSPFTPGAP